MSWSRQQSSIHSSHPCLQRRRQLTDYELPLTRFSEEDNIRLTDIDITIDRVLQKLTKLSPTKAPGVDGISSRVLVELADEIAEPLAIIFQNSLETGEVPRSWKVADVVRIFKKGMIDICARELQTGEPDISYRETHGKNHNGRKHEPSKSL